MKTKKIKKQKNKGAQLLAKLRWEKVSKEDRSAHAKMMVSKRKKY